MFLLKQAPYAGGKVDAQLMPVRLVGRAVIVRLIKGEKSANFELRPTLESPAASGTAAAESFPSEIEALQREKGPGLLITPQDRAGSPVAVTLGPRFDIPLAFVLPTPELAQQAFENLRGLGPIEITPDRPHRAVIFEVGTAAAGRYIGALRVSTPIQQGHARWAEIEALPTVDTPNTLELSWELRAARPGHVVVTNPDGSTLVAPLQQSDDASPNSVAYALELRADDPTSTEVRSTLGEASRIDIQFTPCEQVSRWVERSAGSTNPARETESMLHRFGPVDSPPVNFRIVDTLPQGSADRTSPAADGIQSYMAVDNPKDEMHLRAIALESVAQAVRTGDLHILHERESATES